MGTDGNDILRGSDDLLCALRGSDRVFGGHQNDLLDGGEGGDMLDGSYGNDMLTGGPAPDAFKGGKGRDTATDFTPAEGDTRDASVEAW